ncbi:MAG: DNA mismatch repair endonuclease MutL [Parabacteroides sp.]
MSDIIHVLPDHIANQIAAGEVIQRPASVVKELVENAVDAGATSIQVNIKDAGKTLIQVIDNGKGMSEMDARMAFERHATSKITSAEDLFSLHTMGFRGEALASIAAVAYVELRTCQQGADVGTRLTLAGSVIDEVEPEACAQGSSFSVKNLFFNVPARRKFLKSNDTEFRNIIYEFERVALVNPELSLSLYHNEVEILNLPQSGLRQRILNVYGKNLNQKLLPVDASSSLVSITGFVGRPDSVKKRGALQYFFVNGRFMKHPYFHKAIMQAYDQLIPPGEQPNYFIYFNLDPATIDVNIHPTKTEIKFENEQPIWQILMAAVRETLAKSSAIPTLDFETDPSLDIPVYNPASERSRSYTKPEVSIRSDYNPFRQGESAGPLESVPESAPAFDWTELYQGFEEDREAVRQELQAMGAWDDLQKEKAQAETLTPEAQPQQTELLPSSVSSIPNLCYQYKSRYIVTSLKSGLALVDQHRAHVRILYDQYRAQIGQQQGVSQQLLFPEVVEFTTVEGQTLISLMDELRYVGFDLSPLGNDAYAVNGLPAGVEQTNPSQLLKEVVNQAIELGSSVKEGVESTVALSLAKSAAIRPGKVLSPDEMDHLLSELFSCPDSNLTPDGKIIISLLTDDELERRFK